jgi:DNA-directed RNA polymerase specialized sigma24 family protein
MDVSRCFKRLNWTERHALFLYGICRLTSRETAALMGVSHTQIINLYNTGKQNLLDMMNGVSY